MSPAGHGRDPRQTSDAFGALFVRRGPSTGNKDLPTAAADGLVIAVQSLRRGLQADEVALLTQPRGEALRWRALVPLKRRLSLMRTELEGELFIIESWDCLSQDMRRS